MPRYRVMRRTTSEMKEVDAPTAHEACATLGWMIGLCYVKKLSDLPTFEPGLAVCADYAGYGDENDDE